MARRWWVAVGIAAALVGLPWTTTEGMSLVQLQQERHVVEFQIASTRQQYQQTEGAVYATLQQIAALHGTLMRDEARVAALRTQIAATRVRLAETKAALAATRRRLRYETGLLAGQLQLMEEHGAVGYLDVVLGARSFADLVSRLYLMSQLAAMAGRLVARIQAIGRVEAAQQAALTRQQAMLVSLESAAVAAAEQVQATISQRAELVATLRQEALQQEMLLTRLNQKLAQVTAQIQALLNQYRGGSLSLHQLYNALYPLVAPIAQQFSLPPALVIAVITEESGGNAHAVSSANAIGLMQVEPGTAAQMGYPLSDLFNPQQNVLIGCTYLADMLNLFGHSPSAAANVSPALAVPPGNTSSYLSAALAAYNAGPGAVESYGLVGLFQLPWGVAQYVTRIESLYLQYSAWGAP
jgi:soluble lytic murein transglycosylase-like protein